MNQMLLRLRPKDQGEEKFKEFWENQSYALEPLYKAILELTPETKIVPEDFEKPAFVEKMVWAQAQQDLAKKILALFPKSLTTKA